MGVTRQDLDLFRQLREFQPLGKHCAIIGDCTFYYEGGSVEQFGAMLGFEEVDTFDILGSPTHRVDMNEPLPDEFRNRYDWIIDAGSLYCIFDVATALRNILSMLRPVGTILHTSNLVGHFGWGFYAFGPAFFQDFYRANGFEIRAMAHRLKTVDSQWTLFPPTLSYLKNASDGHLEWDDVGHPLTRLVPNDSLIMAFCCREEERPFTKPLPDHYVRESLPEVVCDADDLEFLWSKIGPAQNRTKVPFVRFQNLYQRILEVQNAGLEGDLVEVGVWKGGCVALMGFMAEKEGRGRRVWAFDSFHGMSKSVPEIDGELSTHPDVQLHNYDFNDFRHTCFDLLELDEATINICPGWVENTLPVLGRVIDKISVLRIDVDWWEPTRDVLEHLYDKVVPGGFVICDDYGYWEGARKAVDEFRAERGIRSPLVQTWKNAPNLKKGTEHFWRVEP